MVFRYSSFAWTKTGTETGKGETLQKFYYAPGASEYEVFERFRRLLDGRSAVLVSHRFSTVRMADRIYVFEGGRIIEEGSHEELVAKGGMYAELYTKQAAAYQ